MTLADPTVLATIGLGLDSAAFGWKAGVGLRWTLPIGTLIHDPGVDLSGQPRGWPDDGYRIYRSDADSAVVYTCADLLAMYPQGNWVSPTAVVTVGVTVHWVPKSGHVSLGRSLGDANEFTLHCDLARLGLRLKVNAREKAGRIDARSYDASGTVVARVFRPFKSTSVVTFAGPGVVRVEVRLSNADVIEICTLAPRAVPTGDLIHTAYPLTTKAAILSSPVAGRLDQTADWVEFATYVQQSKADVDARLPVASATISSGAPPTSGSDTAIIDLLLLFAIDPVIAWLLALLWWDETAVAGKEYLYCVVAEWQGAEYAWPIGPIGRKPAHKFDLPPDIDFTAMELPPLIPTDEQGPTGEPATAAGLSWRTGNVPSGPNPGPADVAVRWRLGRHTFSFGTPNATVSATLAAPNAFSPLAVNDVIDVAPAKAPPYLARDNGFPEGDQWWELTGFDVFGRPGVSVRTGPLSVWDVRVPPPPERLAARWLTAAGAAPASAPADPLITEQDVAWLSANPQANSGALYIGWEWPPSLQKIASGVREFRLYAQPAGAVARLTGEILSVTLVTGSPQFSDVVLDTPLPSARDPFIGGTLRDGRSSFRIVELAAPNEPVNRVRVLNSRDTQPSSPPPAGSPFGTPALVQSISPPAYTTPRLGADATGIANTSPTRAWPERLAIVPKLHPIPTSITSVLSDLIVGDSRRVTVRLGDQLVHPDVSGGIYADSGSTVVGGNEYRAALLTLDAARTLPTGYFDVVLSMPTTDTTVFAAGTAAVFYPGTSVYLPHQSFRSGSSLREYVLVTVTAANDSTAPSAVDDQVHAPDPRWQESNNARHGFESATHSPVTVVDVSRDPPATPQQPVAPLLTTWPDASGTATFTLTWPPQAGLRYVVLRAADETLYAVDRVERKAPYGNYDAAHPSLAALSTTFPAADPQLPDYAAVYASANGVALVQQIASLAENEGAFTPRMAAPQGVADCTAPGASRTIATTVGVDVTSEPGLWLDTTTGNLVFTDTLPGIGKTSYFYRILAVDAVGNRSSLSPSTLPVTTRVKALPRPPILTGSRLGNCAVTILWDHPADDSTDRYLVYCAPDPQQLADLHLLTPDVVSLPTILLDTDLESGLSKDSHIPLFGSPPSLPVGLPAGVGQWGWIGMHLEPGEMHVVVISEKDIPGGVTLRSAPTTPLHVRVIEHGVPEPPEITALDRGGPDGGHLEFTVHHHWHEISAEIRGPEDRVWRSITNGFIMAPVSGALDFTADAGVRYAIRLRTRNGLGVMSATTSGSLP